MSDLDVEIMEVVFKVAELVIHKVGSYKCGYVLERCNIHIQRGMRGWEISESISISMFGIPHGNDNSIWTYFRCYKSDIVSTLQN